MAPTFTGLMLAAPKEYIMVLGGLAMLRVLQGAFVASFGGGKGFTLGPDQPVRHGGRPGHPRNIGAASLWGLGWLGVSWLMEKRDFQALANAN